MHSPPNNINAHMRSAFHEVVGKDTGFSILGSIQLNYTLAHVIRLDTAKIEIGILWQQHTESPIRPPSPVG